MQTSVGCSGRSHDPRQTRAVAKHNATALKCETGEMFKGVVIVVNDWSMELATMVLMDAVKFSSSEVLLDLRGSHNGGSSCNPVWVVVEGRMTQG